MWRFGKLTGPGPGGRAAEWRQAAAELPVELPCDGWVDVFNVMLVMCSLTCFVHEVALALLLSNR